MLEIRIVIRDKFLEPLKLTKDIYAVGRNSEIKIPQLILTDEEYRKISRVHCTLIRVHPTYLVVDGNNQGKHSENGIMVNGCRSRACMLKAGYIVSLSNEVYFELLSDETIEFINPDDTQGAVSEF